MSHFVEMVILRIGLNRTDLGCWRLTLKKGQLNQNWSTSEKENLKKTVITAAELTNSVLRREFRVFGPVGEPGQADKLSFVSLANQIGAALRIGYSQREIVDAVIMAVATDTHLASYLESFKDLSLPQLQELLRNHYLERDNTAAYQDLSISDEPGAERTPPPRHSLCVHSMRGRRFYLQMKWRAASRMIQSWYRKCF